MYTCGYEHTVLNEYVLFFPCLLPHRKTSSTRIGHGHDAEQRNVQTKISVYYTNLLRRYKINDNAEWLRRRGGRNVARTVRGDPRTPSRTGCLHLFYGRTDRRRTRRSFRGNPRPSRYSTARESPCASVPTAIVVNTRLGTASGPSRHGLERNRVGVSTPFYSPRSGDAAADGLGGRATAGRTPPLHPSWLGRVPAASSLAWREWRVGVGGWRTDRTVRIIKYFVRTSASLFYRSKRRIRAAIEIGI